MASDVRRILLVDDETVINEFLQTLLQSGRGSRYQITTARTGADARRLAAEFLPHLVVLDLNLPDGNGAEVCKDLVADPRLRGVVVLAMTSMEDPQWRRQAEQAGAREVLMKPFSLTDFLKKVARYAEESAADASD